MKERINRYMNLPYRMTIVEDTEEGGYVAYFPELPGCITCANTIDELMMCVQDAKRTWFEDMLERGLPIQMPEQTAVI